MFVRLVRIVLLLCLGAVLGVLLSAGGCKRIGSFLASATPSPAPAPSASPTPAPTPTYIPQKRLETSKLFNGMQLRTLLESEPGGTATQERETISSYAVELSVKVKVPKPNQDLAELSKLNEALPQVLPGLASMLPKARVGPGYEALYQRKLTELQRDMTRLDQLLSRHNFFDCETILQLRHPDTKRAAVLLQADMDVDTDGSDSDRLPAVDPGSSTFQPMTSYRWPKQTDLPNPFLPGRQARLRTLEAELAQAKGLGASRYQALRDRVGAALYEVTQLRKNSFLMAATDPYVVLPGILANEADPAFTPHVGDYCAVIFGNTVYPAVVGDVGPSDKVGEASLRLAKELNEKANGDSRPVNTLKVTYLFFPNTADKPFGPPNLAKWYARVGELLNDLGGHGGTLHQWEELSRPAPTPTPTPIPTPTPSPTAIPAPAPASGQLVSGTVAPVSSGSAPTVMAAAPGTTGTGTAAPASVIGPKP